MYRPKYSRPATILYVLSSPLLIIASFLWALAQEAWEMVKEVPDIIRAEIAPEARWAILEPLKSFRQKAKYYLEDVWFTFKGFLGELKLFVTFSDLSSWFWLKWTFKDLLNALRIFPKV
jgi:hypothetical protein